MSNPRFPVYIVSKGRWESRYTSRYLEEMKVPYFIVIEQSEYDQYAAVLDPKKILILDPKFQQEYDAFSNLGATESKGSGPARNFAWEHAKANGHAWYWCVDDNIRGFYRLNKNTKIRVKDGTIFQCMEDFVLRFRNIGMAGPNYAFFCPSKQKKPPFTRNTRIYSCNLIRTDLPFRWRGRYNEDTDLSLRILKAGYCTVLFNAFLQMKMPTLAMKGGNTEVLYANGANKKAKSQMLVDMHPDVARLAFRWNRWHHYVDYRQWAKRKLILAPGVEMPTGVDNYGMELKKFSK